MNLYDFFIEPARTYQEMLMTDLAIVVRNGTSVAWPRNGRITVPCRVHSERTEIVSPDPGDANWRTMKEWVFTLPWDMDALVGDFLSARFIDTNKVMSTIVGETNDPQTWDISLRCYGTVQKSSVQDTTITFRRDADRDGVYEVTLGPYEVKVIQEHVSPIEVPLRFSVASGASLVPVRLVFEGQPNIPIQTGDEFVVDGHPGVIRSVFPGQPQRTEALAFLDFGGVR